MPGSAPGMRCRRRGVLLLLPLVLAAVDDPVCLEHGQPLPFPVGVRPLLGPPPDPPPPPLQPPARRLLLLVYPAHGRGRDRGVVPPAASM